MDQSKAEWFAGRFPYRGPPFVASGWVFKRDVFAYFIGRQESEIVVSPNSIRDVAVTKLLPLPKRASRSCPLPGANVLQNGGGLKAHRRRTHKPIAGGDGGADRPGHRSGILTWP
jgi:hypothetical protein